MQRAIEVGFPIIEINRLAVPERNSFKPIYQMHKWFARRASCVFRMILLGSLKPAIGPDGKPTDLMKEFYQDHQNDPDMQGQVILDPFMGGGTTIVEGLRLGCKVVGIDLNPVAWFVVKTEIQTIDLEKIKEAFKRLIALPIDWNNGAPLQETLRGLYRTEISPGLEADVVYTFWVKHAICTDAQCGREIPLFKDFIVAKKSASVPYHRDATCPSCHGKFDWEVEPATLVAESSVMVNASKGSAGEGRPNILWSYQPEPVKPKGTGSLWETSVNCPRCEKDVRMAVPRHKKARKKVQLTVLLCPGCEAVWQWRGPLPDGEIKCPSCAKAYDPRKGNMPESGKFRCTCGQVDKVIESIRRLPKEKSLPVRPYALQAQIKPEVEPVENFGQTLLFGDGGAGRNYVATKPQPTKLLCPPNGRVFCRFGPSDKVKLQRAESLWNANKKSLPFPKSEIPKGEKTKSGLLAHHYNYWHEMFSARQLLALSTLLRAISAEPDLSLQEMLLCAFSASVGRNNFFCRYHNDRNTIEEVFSRHDFQPKLTITEGNVFGDERVRGTFPQMFNRLLDGKAFNRKAYDLRLLAAHEYQQVFSDHIVAHDNAHLDCRSSANDSEAKVTVAVTDPPYVGNVNYAELSDFYYVWLRLLLKERYPHFLPEYTPKMEEIVENRSRGQSEADFYEGLSKVFRQVHKSLPEDGLLSFSFHHTDGSGTVWEGLLESLCATGFEIAAVYPVHGECESSLHLQDKENISYDLIHICRKRQKNPQPRSWAGIRQEVRRKARQELDAIQKGRYGNQPLAEGDVRLICIGKCLELYSAHYNKVLDHEGKPLPMRNALKDISTTVDQLVSGVRPLPPELEDSLDPVSYAWFRVLLKIRREVTMNDISKQLRAGVSAEDLKREGLIIWGRTGRRRTYEVKQPLERLPGLMESLKAGLPSAEGQGTFFNEENAAFTFNVKLIDILHLLIGLADRGESVYPWLKRFDSRRAQIRAGLRYILGERIDWKEPISRILEVLDGAPLLEGDKA